MKERFFYNDEFERQLKEKADQFKMFPSDKIWNEINSSLHTRRRRFVAGMTILIGGILILAGIQLIFPSKNNIPETTLVAKSNTPANASVDANLHDFAANHFAPETLQNADDHESSIGNTNSGSPFNILSTGFPAHLSVGGDFQEPAAGNISEIREKAIQTVDINLSPKTGAATQVVNLSENGFLSQTPLVHGLAVEEMVIEKTVTPQANIHNDRLSWEIYFAPTLNTHYLSGINYQNMGQSVQNVPVMVLHVANVNGFVDNTPVIGYDIGGNILYRISKNFSLKAGLDFSMNRYYIKAYNSNQPQATVALNSYLGYIADSLMNSNSGYTSIKNPAHYQNRFYQLSIPLGIEMKVAGTGKVQFHLGATIQPSYLLNTDAFVLSDDYTSYSKDAQAFRRWNLNVGAEAFISYTVGKIQWELGPQVRYQIFSTYKDSYPLKENMLNYGIRIGISKTIR